MSFQSLKSLCEVTYPDKTYADYPSTDPIVTAPTKSVFFLLRIQVPLSTSFDSKSNEYIVTAPGLTPENAAFNAAVAIYRQRGGLQHMIDSKLTRLEFCRNAPRYFKVLDTQDQGHYPGVKILRKPGGL